jgi:hypothetical protein
MKFDQAKRLKGLEAENARLKRAVADLTVYKLILKEVAEAKYKPGAQAPVSGAPKNVGLLGAGYLQGAGHFPQRGSLRAAAPTR